jgi:hypothetical protein
MAVAQEAYASAMHKRDELAGRLDAYHAKAVATGAADRAEVARAYAMARDELDRRPARIPIATQLISLYAAYLQVASGESS